MAREPNIPLFLWVATAALAHILWGGGAEQVARVVEDQTSVSRFAQSVRSHVVAANRAVEVDLWDESSLDPDAPTREEPLDPPEPEPAAEVDPPPTPEEDEKQAAKQPDTPKKDEKTPPPETQPKTEKREEQKPKEKKAETETLDKPMKVVPIQRRVSVRQHVEDKNQEDNPNAEFLADEANHTEKQTQARITSMDQDDPAPNPGMDYRGPASDPGNAHVTDLAQSDDTRGDPDRAFSESPEDGDDKQVEQESKQARVEVDPTRTVFGETQAAAKGLKSGSTESRHASKERTAREERVAREASSQVADSPAGNDAVAPESEAQAAQRARSASRAQAAPKGNGGKLPNLRGRESLGLTPGGLNPNLTPLAAISAIGQDQLNKERLADGERRRSKHRGSWRAVGLDRWKSAIQNYVATVQPGNQTSLNTARAPFASYLNRIHNRLHDVFAFKFLGSLDHLPADHSLNRRDLKTHLEIVLSREDGRVVKMGVTRASGATAFDVGALEAVQQASPFGAPPREIVSPDGNVYLHWEFHRDPIYACSTYFARPFILRVSPTPAPLPSPSGPPARPEEKGQNDSQETEEGAPRKGG